MIWLLFLLVSCSRLQSEHVRVKFMSEHSDYWSNYFAQNLNIGENDNINIEISSLRNKSVMKNINISSYQVQPVIWDFNITLCNKSCSKTKITLSSLEIDCNNKSIVEDIFDENVASLAVLQIKNWMKKIDE